MDPNIASQILDSSISPEERIRILSNANIRAYNVAGQANTAYHNNGSLRPEPIPRTEVFTRENHNNMRELEELLKVRHLRRSERRNLHRPKSDWEESKRGEVLKCATTLEIADILEKYAVRS